MGSEDFEIRIFRGEELLGEITEADKVVLLQHIKNTPRYVYCVTMYVYDVFVCLIFDAYVCVTSTGVYVSGAYIHTQVFHTYCY